MKVRCLFSLIFITVSCIGCKSVDDSAYNWQYTDSKYYNYNGEVKFTRREWTRFGVKDSLLNEKLTIFDVKDTNLVLISCQDRTVQFEFKGTAQSIKEIKEIVKSRIMELGADH